MSGTFPRVTSDVKVFVKNTFLHVPEPEDGEPSCKHGRSHSLPPRLSHIKTMMIYNIPFQATPSQVFARIHESGFAGTYDSVHIPLSKGSKKQSRILGFAFITFKTSELAALFSSIFQNISFPNCKSDKLTCTKASDHQGQACNLNSH